MVKKEFYCSARGSLVQSVDILEEGYGVSAHLVHFSDKIVAYIRTIDCVNEEVVSPVL